MHKKFYLLVLVLVSNSLFGMATPNPCCLSQLGSTLTFDYPVLGVKFLGDGCFAVTYSEFAGFLTTKQFTYNTSTCQFGSGGTPHTVNCPTPAGSPTTGNLLSNLAYSPSCNLLALGFNFSPVYSTFISNAASCTLTSPQIISSTTPVNWVAFSDSGCFAQITGGNTITAYNCSFTTPSSLSLPHSGVQVAFAPSSASGCGLAAVTTGTNYISLINISSSCMITAGPTVPAGSGVNNTTGIAFSPNGKCLAVTDPINNYVSMFQLVPSDCQIELVGSPYAITNTGNLAFSADGGCLAITTSTGVNVYPVNSDCTLNTTNYPTLPFSGVVALDFTASYSSCDLLALASGNTVTILQFDSISISEVVVNCDLTLTVSGTASIPGTSVTIYSDGVEIATTPASSTGTFSVTTSPVKVGNHSITARETNSYGCATSSADFPVSVHVCKKNLKIRKCCPKKIGKDGLVTYTISVRNIGKSPTSNVVVTDKLPCCLNFITCSGTGWSCHSAGQIVTATYANTLAPQETATFTIQAKADHCHHKTVTNKASATSSSSISGCAFCSSKVRK